MIDFIDISASRAAYKELRGHAGGIYDVAWSTDRRQIVSASSDGTVRLWNTLSWSNLSKYRDSGEPLWAVDMAPIYGHYLLTGGNDRCVNMYSVDNLKVLRKFVGDCYGPVTSVKFHSNINYIASGSSDRVVRLFDIRTGAMVRSFSGHKVILTKIWTDNNFVFVNLCYGKYYARHLNIDIWQGH